MASLAMKCKVVVGIEQYRSLNQIVAGKISTIKLEGATG